MDDTWRKVKGSKVAVDGTVIRLQVETVDGATTEVHLVPEAVTLLVAELVNAKTRALMAAGGDLTGELDPVRMRTPIEAEKLVITDYTDDGRTLVQVLMTGGGVFEFLVPNHGATISQARGR